MTVREHSSSEDRQARVGPNRESFARWLAKRSGAGVVTLLVVTVIVFLATQAMPGNVAHIILGKNATHEQIVRLKDELNLDEPLIEQYWDWLSGLLTGDLGRSLISGEPVGELLVDRVINSAILGGVSMVIIVPVSLIVGMLAALRRDRPSDRTFMGTSLFVTALPDFVIGSVVIVLFATTVFPVLPPVSLIPPGELPFAYPERLIMPVAVFVLVGVAYLSRLVRVSFIDVMESEYVQLATVKGLSRVRIVLRHVLPNAVAPSIPAAAILAANTLAGLIVIEYLFAYPGVGSALVDAVVAQDLPVIQAIMMLMAIAFYLLNFTADVVGKLDKRP